MIEQLFQSSLLHHGSATLVIRQDSSITPHQKSRPEYVDL